MNLHRSYSFPTVLVILSLLSIRVTQACKCSYPASVSDAYNESYRVFLGNVTNVTKTSGGGSDPYLISLDVIESWKGDNSSTVQVYTSSSSASCGYIDFLPEESGVDPVGKEFLVYTTMNDNGEEWVSGCSGTKPLDSEIFDVQAEIDDLDSLVRGEDATGRVSNSTSPATSRSLYILVQFYLFPFSLFQFYMM